MFEQYCIDVIKYIEQNGTIRTEQILDKLGIPTKYATAINSELEIHGWVILTNSGPILKPAGKTYLTKLELSSPKQPHEKILEFLKPHGIGQFVIINPILLKLFTVNDRHDNSEVQQVTRQIKELLNGMESKNLIQLDPNKFNHLGSGNTTEGFKWLDTTIIKASIKTQGLDLLKREQPKITGDTIIYAGTLIHNSPITQSSVSTYVDQSQPLEIEINDVTNKSQKSIWKKTLKWMGNHIIQILISLLVAYLIYRFGWT